MLKFNFPTLRKSLFASYRSGRNRFRLARRSVLVLFAIGGLFGSFALLKLVRRVSADTTTPVSISTFGTPVTQDFNSLVSSGTGTLATNTPPGWGFSESSTNANTTYTA